MICYLKNVLARCYKDFYHENQKKISIFFLLRNLNPTKNTDLSVKRIWILYYIHMHIVVRTTKFASIKLSIEKFFVRAAYAYRWGIIYASSGHLR